MDERLIEDVLIEIFLYLDLKTISRMKRSCQFFKQFTDLDRLWLRKLDHDYSLDVVNAGKRTVKPRRRYILLKTIQHPGRAISKGYLDVLISVSARRLPSDEDVCVGVRKGRLEILEWCYNRLIPNRALTEALKISRWEVVDWLIDRGFRPNDEDTLLTIALGQLNLLKIYASMGVIFPIQAMRFAIANERTEIVSWLITRGINLTNQDLELALRKGNLSLLELFPRELVIYQHSFRVALKMNNLPVLDWIFERGFRPDESTNELIDLELLEYLASRWGVNPTPKQIDRAIEQGRLEIVKLNSVTFTPAQASMAYRKGYLDILALIEKTGVIPDHQPMIDACISGNIEQLEEVAKRGYPIDHRGIVAAIEYQRIEILEWFYRRGREVRWEVLIDSRIQNREKIDVHRWLLEKKIFPDQKIIDCIWIDPEICERRNLQDLCIGNNLLPSQKAIDTYFSRPRCQQQLVHLLLEKWMYPSQEVINELYTKDNRPRLEILAKYQLLPTNRVMQTITLGEVEWLDRKGFRLTVNEANLAAKEGQIDVLDYLWKKKIYPDGEGLSSAFYLDRLDSLKWFMAHGVRYTSDWEQLARQSKSQKILNWIKELGVAPN